MSRNIGEHDLKRKMKQAQKFLIKKEQVRVQAVVKGRERSRNDDTARMLNELFSMYLQSHGTCANQARPDSLNMTINPKK